MIWKTQHNVQAALILATVAIHQLYNTGHFFEMAVEHKRLTGQDKVLEAAKRFADNVDSVFGPGKRYDAPGHEEVELALVKLYRATGEKRYLDLCRFFLDERSLSMVE